MNDCKYHNHYSYPASNVRVIDEWFELSQSLLLYTQQYLNDCLMIRTITVYATIRLLVREWSMNNCNYHHHRSCPVSNVKRIHEWLHFLQIPLLPSFYCESGWWLIAIITITTPTRLLIWEWLMNDCSYHNHNSYLAPKLLNLLWLQLSQWSLLLSF